MAKNFFRTWQHTRWAGVYADPLRDVQQELPVDRCRDCGGELYRWDRVVLRGVRRLCPHCAEKYIEMEAKERKP